MRIKLCDETNLIKQVNELKNKIKDYSFDELANSDVFTCKWNQDKTHFEYIYKNLSGQIFNINNEPHLNDFYDYFNEGKYQFRFFLSQFILQNQLACPSFQRYNIIILTNRKVQSNENFTRFK